MPTFYSDTSVTIQVDNSDSFKREINEVSTSAYLKLLKASDLGKFSINKENPEGTFDRFFSILKSAADLAFPIKIKKKSHKKFNPWFTVGLSISSKQRQVLFSKKLKYPNDLNVSKFKEYNTVFNKLKRKAKKMYYLSSFQEAKSNLKSTWKLINEITGRPSKGQSKNLPNNFLDPTSGEQICGEKNIANGFNTFFASIGPELASNINRTHLPDDNFLKYMGPKVQANFIMSEISEFQLNEIVKALKPKTSFGDDCISGKLIKLAIPYLLSPLTKLFNLSLQSGFVPKQLKLAKVLPLHKSSSPKQFTNYRPIAITSTISKMLERVVCNKLLGFLDSEQILHPNQFGFRRFHNVTQPLMLFTDKVAKSLNNNLFNLAIFIDLKKAFDTVNFNILLKKLEFYGVRGIALAWFVSYLEERCQFVLAGNSISDIITMLCGIPQGTILGPLLFLLFINDLPFATEFFTLLFADDTTLQLEGENLTQLFQKANFELTKAQDWFSSNLLTLNIKKTKFMIFQNGKQLLGENQSLSFGPIPIDRVCNSSEEKSVRFLGILVDEKLNFSNHITFLKMKLSLALYQLHASRFNSPESVRKAIYLSLFESHVRFGSLVYGSASLKELEEISILQRKALRVVAGVGYRDHTDPLFQRLKILKFNDLVTLERILFVHGFRKNHLPSSFKKDFLTGIDLDSMSRRDDNLCYSTPIINSKELARSPKYLMIRAWNDLPYDLKTLTERKTLKLAFIERALFSYSSECYTLNCFSCNRN